ncbi:glycosyltransferase family 2 protein [Moraxella osloensis]|nr:glycosyltransferase family 2 protein [Moraxella osloensis]QRO13661.1 glycosyltransferase family 2 protein [Moraxella osloensis]
MISIITATFNRERLIKKLYDSLCNQTCQNFEWIVIDDGSTDNTNFLFDNFVKENRIKINYIKKSNGGKHTALNLGIDLAIYEFIMFVDSDDYIPLNTIDVLITKLNYIKTLEEFEKLSGICGDNQDQNGRLIGTPSPNNKIMNYLDYRYKLKIKGDKSEIYRTKVLKEFKFPEFANEKFCPEALVWNRIAKYYDMFFFNDIVYVRYYQKDGLTSKITEIRRKSPKSTLLYYKEFATNPKIPYYFRLRAVINYLRFKVL